MLRSSGQTPHRRVVPVRRLAPFLTTASDGSASWSASWWPRLAVWLAGLALAHLGLPSATALDPARTPSQYTHDVYRMDDGLPQNSVTSIAQTSDGYLWFATERGLGRFDGLTMAVHDQSNLPWMGSQRVRALSPGEAGELWLGTEEAGLGRFPDGLWLVSGHRGLDEMRVVRRDEEGALWLGTSAGLLRLHKGTLTRVGPPMQVLALAPARGGGLWVGAGPRVFRAQGETLTPRYEAPDPGLRIQALQEDSDGTLWLGTQRGLFKLRGPEARGGLTAQGRGADDGRPPPDISTLLRDKDGNLWMGTSRGVLRRGPDASVARFGVDEGLSNESVLSLFEDREGSVWIGTLSGVNRLRDAPFWRLRLRDGLASELVWSLYEDPGGALWIGTQAGLNRLRDGVMVTFRTEDGLAGNAVWSTLQDRQGRLWVGSETGMGESGLARREAGRFLRLGPREGFAHRSVRALAETRNGDVWIGSTTGLTRHRDGVFRDWGPADGLRATHVWCLTESEDSSLWIGTLGDGLVRLRDGRFQSLTVADGLASNRVTALLADGPERLWIGTLGGGLHLWQGGRITRFDLGLPGTKDVLRILDDGRGYLWLNQAFGVVRVSRAELLAQAAGTLDGKLHVTRFERDDGLTTDELNGRSQNAGWRGRDGRLWFPTVKGVAVADPARLSEALASPVAVLQRLEADGRAVPLHGAVLAAGTRELVVAFTAPTFVAPGRLRFRYRLLGYDSDWVDAGANRHAHYTRLPGGSYRFRVAAARPGGDWAEPEATADFEVRRRFHEEPLFAVFALGAILLFSWGVFGWRGRAMTRRAERAEAARRLEEARTAGLRSLAAQLGQAEDAERRRLARDLHDSVGQSLSAMKLSVAAALAEAAPTRGPSLLRGALDELDAVISQVRTVTFQLYPTMLEDLGLVRTIERYADHLAHGRLRIDIRESGPPQLLPGPLAAYLFRAVKELLGNAAKHAEAQQVVVAFHWRPDALRIAVTDDGRGFDVDRALAPGGSDGLGLRDLRERVAHLGGSLAVESEPGLGTQVIVDVPVAAARPAADASKEG